MIHLRLVEGVEAYLRYEGNVEFPVSMREFFAGYDPETLQPSRTRPLQHLLQEGAADLTVSRSKLEQVEARFGRSIALLLHDRYCTQRRNAAAIAQEFGVGKSTIYTWMKELGMPRRSRGERAVNRPLRKTKRMQDIETRFGRSVKALLQTLYIEQGLSGMEVGEILGISAPCVRRWARREGLRVRNPGESKLAGEKPGRDALTQRYVEDQQTIATIAKEYGVSKSTIRLLLVEYGIERRDRSDNNRRRYGITVPTEGDLLRLYEEERLPSVRIAEQYEVSPATVGKWLDAYGIPKRTNVEVQLKKAGARIPTSDQLHRMYVEEEWAPREIGKACGVAGSTVLRWLERAGIPKRTQSEAQLLRNRRKQQQTLESAVAAYERYCKEEDTPVDMLVYFLQRPELRCYIREATE